MFAHKNMDSLARQTATFFLTVFIGLIACNNSGNDNPITPDAGYYSFKDYFFKDTLGKTFFIYRESTGSTMISDVGHSTYLTFKIDSGRTAIFYKDEVLRNIHSMVYYAQMVNLPFDTSYAYIRNGIIKGRKINKEQWKISINVVKNKTNEKISIDTIFTKSKDRITIADDGRIF